AVEALSQLVIDAWFGRVRLSVGDDLGLLLVGQHAARTNHPIESHRAGARQPALPSGKTSTRRAGSGLMSVNDSHVQQIARRTPGNGCWPACSSLVAATWARVNVRP